MSANWWGISATIVAWSGVIIILLAIVGPWIKQRIKRRRRCPKCWYDMSHSPGMTCSECGYTAMRERKLYKAHRRWKLAFFGAFMLIGAYALNVTPAVKDRGLIAAVPTTALIIALPWLEVPEVPRSMAQAQAPDAILEKLFWEIAVVRMEDLRLLSAWEQRLLLRRLASRMTERLRTLNADGSEELYRLDFYLVRSLHSHHTHARLGDDLPTILDPLLRALAHHMVVVRGQWPVDVPLWLHARKFGVHTAIPWETRLFLVDEDGSLSEIPLDHRPSSLRQSWSCFVQPIEVGVLAAQTSELRFQVQMRRTTENSECNTSPRCHNQRRWAAMIG